MVFADSKGELKILDGYCRHMGGDLSQGTIKGDEVACPFHDWRWGGDGKCKLVPYAKRTPRLARTRAWTTDVRSGLLFVWHDVEGNPPPPEVRIPELPEAASDEWTDWRWNSILIEGANCREIIDNVTDMAHFFYIHFGLPTYFKNVFEGHIATQYLHNVGRPDVNDMGTTYGEAHLDSEASYFGPSFMINWLHNNYGGFKAESILINCHYPVTQDSFVLQWGVIVEKPKGLDETTTDKLAAGFTEGVSKGFLQDVEIWKHKTRIDNPLLVEEDGAVYQMRRWYQQFYVDVADVSPDMVDRFEIEVDTTAANEKWQVEVEENLSAGRRKGTAEQDIANDKRDSTRRDPMRPRRRRPAGPLDAAVARRARRRRSSGRQRRSTGSWRKAPDFAEDPQRAAAVREATARDRERYLNAGLTPVDCRFCHVTVAVKKLGPEHTAVQWNSEAIAAVRDVRRGARQRRRQQPQPVLPAAVRQHQARRRGGLPRRGVDRAVARRRLAVRPTLADMWGKGLALVLALALAGCTRIVDDARPLAQSTGRTHLRGYRSETCSARTSSGRTTTTPTCSPRSSPRSAAGISREVDPPFIFDAAPAAHRWRALLRRVQPVRLRRGDGGRLPHRLRRPRRDSRGQTQHRVLPERHDGGDHHARRKCSTSASCPKSIPDRLTSCSGPSTASTWACDNAYVAAHNAAVELTTCGDVNGYDVLTLAKDALKRIETLVNTVA